MAFILKDLNPIGGQSSDLPRIWFYTTDDAAATVDTTGYFNAASDRLKVNDLIFRITKSSGAPSTFGIHIVNSNTGGVVDVADAISAATSLTDTD